MSANGSAPPCEHLDGLAPVTLRSSHCPDCDPDQNDLAALLVCLACGWVACSNDSPGRHAKAHYEKSDHPVAATVEPGSRWRWCYVHQRLV